MASHKDDAALKPAVTAVFGAVPGAILPPRRWGRVRAQLRSMPRGRAAAAGATGSAVAATLWLVRRLLMRMRSRSARRARTRARAEVRADPHVRRSHFRARVPHLPHSPRAACHTHARGDSGERVALSSGQQKGGSTGRRRAMLLGRAHGPFASAVTRGFPTMPQVLKASLDQASASAPAPARGLCAALL